MRKGNHYSTDYCHQYMFLYHHHKQWESLPSFLGVIELNFSPRVGNGLGGDGLLGRWKHTEREVWKYWRQTSQLAILLHISSSSTCQANKTYRSFPLVWAEHNRTEETGIWLTLHQRYFFLEEIVKGGDDRSKGLQYCTRKSI